MSLHLSFMSSLTSEPTKWKITLLWISIFSIISFLCQGYTVFLHALNAP